MDFVEYIKSFHLVCLTETYVRNELRSDLFTEFPTQSPYHTQNGYGVEIIEKCVLDICYNTEEFLLLMCGDFNARTGIRNGTRDF